ncbi:glycine--tRNA ligase [Candidatus Dojkabacteria bacterium]|nr:glycine--tRNA ligase [Candidatus Dojkabacteria bacterium]
MNKQASLEKITAWAKRRGFIYPSSEIYGGLANNYDFGPYGTELKNNIRDLWWKRFVVNREDMVGIDASIILNSKVWEASGHTESFADVMIDCKNCKNRTRIDHLIEDKFNEIFNEYSKQKDYKGGSVDDWIVKVMQRGKVEGLSIQQLKTLLLKYKEILKCPVCGKFDWTEPRKFNQLFETHIGILEESKSLAYLRGEIAQGLFLNFKNVLDSTRVRLPFGIAQQGKAFRNEITKGQLLHRTLEFDLMEFEYFIREKDWKDVYAYWEKEMWQYALDLGIDGQNLRWREHEEFERSHYSKMTKDIEYEYPFGWKEMFGLAYRTDFDLKNHMKNSGQDLNYTDPNTNEKFIPHVVEPTFGLSRLIGILMFEGYNEEEVNGKQRVIFKIDPKIAPVKAAIFPLQKDEKLKNLAREIFEKLRKEFSCEFDDAGNIGKMYRRQDEIGTPWCVTIDFDSLKDNSATIRDRDTMKQERVKISDLENWISGKLS